MIKTIIYRVIATLTFFTRLPLWRIADVPRQHYERVVPLWPLAGWLTGGLMAVVFWLTSFILPTDVCIILALMSRIILTGGLHEDGFADFCDGFGGGSDRKRILEIMKDSHIGTYGVLGLSLCFLLLFTTLSSIPATLLPWVFLCADPLAKWMSSNIVRILPYARSEAEAKNRLVYSKTTPTEYKLSCLFGFLPLILLHLFGIATLHWLIALILPVVSFTVMTLMMSRRIGGYTGDCCGALFTVCELTFYLGIAAIHALL